MDRLNAVLSNIEGLAEEIDLMIGKNCVKEVLENIGMILSFIQMSVNIPVVESEIPSGFWTIELEVVTQLLKIKKNAIKIQVKMQAISLNPSRVNWLIAVVTISKICFYRRSKYIYIYFSILADETTDCSNEK